MVALFALVVGGAICRRSTGFATCLRERVALVGLARKRCGQVVSRITVSAITVHGSVTLLLAAGAVCSISSVTSKRPTCRLICKVISRVARSALVVFGAFRLRDAGHTGRAIPAVTSVGSAAKVGVVPVVSGIANRALVVLSPQLLDKTGLAGTAITNLTTPFVALQVVSQEVSFVACGALVRSRECGSLLADLAAIALSSAARERLAIAAGQKLEAHIARSTVLVRSTVTLLAASLASAALACCAVVGLTSPAASLVGEVVTSIARRTLISGGPRFLGPACFAPICRILDTLEGLTCLLVIQEIAGIAGFALIKACSILF
mmetsp:Transcript_22511/g.52139  ORF Transcript_22511/g.52139 Transcript_22511/m.52139 type:complete len:321 (-) Transcript_22511:782-1744(-)